MDKLKEMGMFAVKTGIVLIGIFILVSIILPDFSKLKRFETPKPKPKLILLSFVQNPRALLKISEIEEADGKIENAIMEMELAIGLLEMHNADKQVIQRYSNRIEKLMVRKNERANCGYQNGHPC